MLTIIVNISKDMNIFTENLVFDLGINMKGELFCQVERG